MEAVRNLGLQDCVAFAGVHANPGPFMASADIMVHCSFQDSYTQSIAEALSLGTPVVANREVAFNFSDRPSNIGITAAASTPDGIADAVTQLATDTALRQEMGQRGREAVARELSWDSAVTRFLALYRSN